MGLDGARIIMSGGSRGIGLAIALRAAREGASVAIFAKTDQPHPKLEGTVHTAAAAIEEAGGRPLPIVGDVRDEDSVAEAVARTAEEFGGIDIVVNNASAVDLSNSTDLAMKRYDLMQDINTRGAFLLTRSAVPHLRESEHAHVLTLSPPLGLQPHWAGRHLGYAVSKWGMSLTTLGFADELADDGIGVNSLWPRTTIATAAVSNLLGGDAVSRTRTPEIVADAAYEILNRDPRVCTGNFFIDDDVLVEAGVTDLDRYRVDPAAGDLDLDLFVDR